MFKDNSYTRKVLVEKSPYASIIDAHGGLFDISLTGESVKVKSILTFEEFKKILSKMHNNEWIDDSAERYYLSKDYSLFYVFVDGILPDHIILKADCKILKNHV
jgi:hypothetical protein